MPAAINTTQAHLLPARRAAWYLLVVGNGAIVVGNGFILK